MFIPLSLRSFAIEREILQSELVESLLPELVITVTKGRTGTRHSKRLHVRPSTRKYNT